MYGCVGSGRVKRMVGGVGCDGVGIGSRRKSIVEERDAEVKEKDQVD